MGLCMTKSITSGKVKISEIKKTYRLSDKDKKKLWKRKSINAPQLVISNNLLYKRRMLQIEKVQTQALMTACDSNSCSAIACSCIQCNELNLVRN
ncbi:unnamed protein product [Blepharisma stoltei]|uniref:Uncharacterized protein n=1 Tax=Blepharisma stoltei TaxID=1481888 RepID=A0AAU9IUM7_9CILI|nr:unnamed protein product [Blepharisma stoltei]